jgi:hypothetical protein
MQVHNLYFKLLYVRIYPLNLILPNHNLEPQFQFLWPNLQRLIQILLNHGLEPQFQFL